MRIYLIPPPYADDAMPFDMADAHQIALMHNRRERERSKWRVNPPTDPNNEVTGDMLAMTFLIVAAMVGTSLAVGAAYEMVIGWLLTLSK